MISKFFSGLRNRLEEEKDALSPKEFAALSRIIDTKSREYIEVRLGVPITNFTSYNDYLTAGCSKIWAAMRAVDIVAATVISANFRVVDMNSDIPTSQVPINPKDHDWLKFCKGSFLAKPNEFDTWEELIRLIVAHLEFTGNAYLVKDDFDLKGRPTSIYPLLPQYVKPVPDRHNKVSAYKYEVNGSSLEYKAEDVIHIKYPHPNHAINGLGSMESGESLYKRFIGKNDLDIKFMENGSQPSGILTLDDGSVTDEEEWEHLKRKYNAQYGGRKNAGKVAFLNGKWTFHKLGLTMEEMEAIESEKWTVEQIFLNHGVPLSVAGVQGAANYAVARQDEHNFRRYKVVPLIDVIVAKLNTDGFIQAGGDGYKLAYELYGVIDVEQITKAHIPLIREGVITRNELRELIGMPRMDNPYMDQITVPAHSIPIELAGLANLSNEDMLRVYGNIIGGATEAAIEGDLEGDPQKDDDNDEDDEPTPTHDSPNSGPFPPPKKGKASRTYPAKKSRRK